jgi:hypothetical protein
MAVARRSYTASTRMPRGAGQYELSARPGVIAALAMPNPVRATLEASRGAMASAL